MTDDVEEKLSEFMSVRGVHPEVAALLAQMRHELLKLEAVVYAAGKTMTTVVNG